MIDEGGGEGRGGEGERGRGRVYLNLGVCAQFSESTQFV